MYEEKSPFQAGIAWLILSTIFLTLPGTAFPTENWLSVINFDKIVHVVIFGGLVILFCRGIYKRADTGKKINTSFFVCMLLAILYGVIIEFVQKHLIPNRSFDITDIIADSAGAVAGFVFSIRAYRKK